MDDPDSITEIKVTSREYLQFYSNLLLQSWANDKDTLTQQTYRYSMAIDRIGMTTAHVQLV